MKMKEAMVVVVISAHQVVPGYLADSKTDFMSLGWKRYVKHESSPRHV